MEKIAQTSVSSNSSSIMMDLSKNVTKLSNNNNSNFKDYIKNNNVSEKNSYKKKDEPSNNEVRSDEKRKTIHDEDKNIGKMSTKKELKNTDQSLVKNETKTNNEETKNQLKELDSNEETKDVSLSEETKIDEENVKKEISDVKEIINMIANLVDNPVKFIQEIKKIPQELVQEVQTTIENIKEIPKELKNNLLELLNSSKKDEKIKSDLVQNLIQDDNISKLKEIAKDEKIFKAFIEKSDTQDDVKQSFEKFDIETQLSILKQGQTSTGNNNNISDIEFNKNIEDNTKQDNIISVSEALNNNIKIFGNNNTRILSELKANSINPEQIQNFSKIVEEMRIAFRDNKTTLNIKLEPESLGKLSVKIHSENGVLSASFFVESEKAKQAIENQIQILKQALSDQNINVQDINVQVGQNNEDLNYHKNIMEAINFSKRDSVRGLEDEDFADTINPYLKEDLFNDLI